MVLNYALGQLYLYLTLINLFLLEDCLLGHDTTDVLKECTVSIFRVKKQAVQINNSCLAFIFILGVTQSLGTVASSGPTVTSSDDTSTEHCWTGMRGKP
jgi:hypothetical protein